jgi:NagD protein
MVNDAIEMIIAGSKFIATNTDPSPRKSGWNNVGIAATTAMIEEATGKSAFAIGKPSPVMMRAVLSGIADKKSLKTYAYKPTLVSNTVNDIKRPLPWWHS